MVQRTHPGSHGCGLSGLERVSVFTVSYYRSVTLRSQSESGFGEWYGSLWVSDY